MLNKEERTILRYVLDNSPDPNAISLISFDETQWANSPSLDRLCHLGLLKQKGLQPICYQITPYGRQFFRNEIEEKQRIRKERCGRYIEHFLFSVLGSIVTLLIQWIFTQLF